MAAGGANTVDLLGDTVGGGGGAANSADLLGEAIPAWENELYSVPKAEPGKILDLSGGSSSGGGASGTARQPSGFGGGSSGCGSNSSLTGFGGGSAASSHPGPGAGAGSPASIEGGPGLEISLATPLAILQQLAHRPITELVQESGRHLMEAPRTLMRVYSSSTRYLRPWGEFARMRPGNTIDGFRRASQRGELQIHLQRNVLANIKSYCPNYACLFMAMLLMFVATSPMLLGVMAATGGGWSHAMRSDSFRNRPWTLQIGQVYVPLGSNIKMAIMVFPTLFMLHFFMGPVLWSAALYSGGVSLAHAALRDREHDDDRDDGPFSQSTVQIQELP